MRNHRNPKKPAAVAGLTIGALGVVFGDIGTSPLYALQAVFGSYGLRLDTSRLNVLGIISLIIWSITVIVSIKYVLFVMRADNKGEGGVLALTSLLKRDRKPLRRRGLYILLGLIGVALFYGDSTITPAISVLSAVEGLGNVSADLKSLVVPVTLLLLTFLFWVQRYGTGLIGKLFGPIMLLWFIVIGSAGAAQIVQQPDVLAALLPLAAVRFIAAEPLTAFLTLGVVILAVTGAEALYADMGHFGRRPISRAWFMVVFPALILCYLGQGGVLLGGDHMTSPFMALFPAHLQIITVILATLATLIASQSVISGAFSLTRQAIQLDFLPRMRILHTSNHESGQIYVPFINLMLYGVVVFLVLTFGSSAHLAGVYGIAVSGTLAIDSLLFLAVAHYIWHKPIWWIGTAAVLFGGLDLLFVSANLPKIIDGGWLPLSISAVVLVVAHTWYRGQRIVAAERRALEGSLQAYVDQIRRRRPALVRAEGCAVYIGHHAGLAPLALHAAVEKLQELHQKVVIISVRVTTAAHIADNKRAIFDNLGYNDGISQLRLSYGYHDVPNIPHTLEKLRGISPELNFDPAQATYFISLSRIIASRKHTMAGWRKLLYGIMSRNALSTSDYYKLPVERTIEMRSLIEI